MKMKALKIIATILLVLLIAADIPVGFGLIWHFATAKLSASNGWHTGLTIGFFSLSIAATVAMPPILLGVVAYTWGGTIVKYFFKEIM